MGSGGGFDIAGNIAQAVGGELFAADLAASFGLAPVTARDVRNAGPGGAIDVFLQSRGVDIFDRALTVDAGPVVPAMLGRMADYQTVANALAVSGIGTAADQTRYLQTVAAECGPMPSDACLIDFDDRLRNFLAMGGVPRPSIYSRPMATAGMGVVPMSSPFDLTVLGSPFQTGSIPGPSQPESFLGSLVSALPSLIGQLAAAGVIRGSVGQAFAPMANTMQTSAVGMVPSGFLPLALPSPATVGGLATAGSLALDAMSSLASLFGGGTATGGCGRGRPPVQAPSLFRMNACGGMTLPARQQVVGPDGSLYIIASLGKATRGSREASTMRRLARDNGFTVARKGTRRRSPR